MFEDLISPVDHSRHGGHTGRPGVHDYAKGTTTLAFIYQGGIIVCVDSRATMGQYIGSQHVHKVIEINPRMLGTMAGGAADCKYWERYLAMEVRLFELKHNMRISTAGASKILCNIVSYYKGRGLSMGTMIAGYDGEAPGLYYVDSEGNREKGRLFSVGSGSTFAYGVLDTGYRFDMTTDEAVDLARRAIYHATHRDAYSGGIVNCYHVEQQGWSKKESFDCLELHERYQAEKEARE